MAFLDENNNANYTFYKNFPDERLQDLPEDIAADDIILFGSIYASSREVRRSVVRFLEMGLERGAIIIYDRSGMSFLLSYRGRICSGGTNSRDIH